MRDPAASAFERQFLAWLHIHLGVEPTENAGTNAFWWSFPFKESTVSFVVVGRQMNGAVGPPAGSEWLLRVEEDEDAGFIALVAPHFVPGAGIRRRMGQRRVRVQFKSRDLIRAFEDQREGTGLPAVRHQEPAVAAEPSAPEAPGTPLNADLQVLMQSQFPVLRVRHAARNLRPSAAFMNREGHIFARSADDLDPALEEEAAINRLTFHLRDGLRDGALLAGAVFFHGGLDGERLFLRGSSADAASVIAGYFQHRNGEALHMQVRYAPPGAESVVPGQWDDAKMQIWPSRGLPLVTRMAGRWLAPATGQVEGSIVQCAIDPAGQFGLVLPADGPAMTWGLADGETNARFSLPLLRGSAHALDASRLRMLQGHVDGRLVLYDILQSQEAHVFRSASGMITSCALAADGRSAFAGTIGGDFIRCDLDWFSMRTLRMKDHMPVSVCACTPDGAHALTASANGRMALWKMHGDMPITLAEHETPLKDARFGSVSADGRWALVAGGQIFLVWDLRTNTLGPLTDAGAIIDACAIGPDGQLVLLGLRTGVLRLWDEPRGMTRQDWDASDVATAMAFTPDGASALVGYTSGAVEYIGILPPW